MKNKKYSVTSFDNVHQKISKKKQKWKIKNIAINIYRWFLLTIIIQIIALYYFDSVYFVKKSEITLTSYTDGENKKSLKNGTSVSIPIESKFTKVSFDANYVAYILNGGLEFTNVKNKKNIKKIKHQENIISYCRWLHDRNIIVYAEKIMQGGKQTGLQIYTYDVEAEVEKKYPKITSSIATMYEVTDIEASPFTNVVYVKVCLNEKISGIYRFNIMDEIRHVMDTENDTIVEETNFADNLVYQDSDKRIFVRDGTGRAAKELKFQDKVELLRVDLDDKVYVGLLNNTGEVEKICCGKITDKTEQWSTIGLGKPVRTQDVYISLNGGIYTNMRDESTLYNLKDGQKTKIDGEFIDIINDYIIIRNKDKVIFKTI